MITKNFARYMYGCSYADNARQNRQNASVIDMDGTESTAPEVGMCNTWFKNFTSGPSSNRGDFWLVLGDDNTRPTPGDYKLGNEITGPTPLVGDYIFNSELDDGKIRIYRTFANNTDNDISVSEVGLVVRVSTNAGDKNILIAREALGSKYVIKSGGYRRSVSTSDRYCTQCAA